MSQGSSGDDKDREPEIVWVGEQRLMDGYCGRAPAAMPTPPPAVEEQPRPVASVRRKPGQKKVVRIGPPRAAAA